MGKSKNGYIRVDQLDDYSTLSTLQKAGITFTLACLIALVVVCSITLHEVTHDDDDNGSESSSSYILNEPKDCPKSLKHDLTNSLKALETSIEMEVLENSGEEIISWSTYNSNPSLYTYRKVGLRNLDFSTGTVLIDQPGWFILLEDVIFSPNPENSFFPYPSQTQYTSNPAFNLGFFAAIAMYGNHTILDLNGHTIQQSVAHNLNQRFYAHIELADSPFIPSQGPIGTPPSIRSATYSVIRGTGNLIFSAHHGIHGNSGSNIYIHDIALHTYEVAPISLNGFNRVVIENVEARGTNQKIPVISTFAQSVFDLRFSPLALQLSGGSNPTEESILSDATDALQLLVNQTNEDVVDGSGTIDQMTHPEAYDLFANPSGLMDGNSYGFLFNPVGIAVFGFLGDRTTVKSTESSDFYVNNCKIFETKNSVREVVALRSLPSLKAILGPNADAVAIADIVAENGTYQGTALSDFQFALAQLVSLLPEEDQNIFSQLFIPDDLIQWYNGTDPLVYNMTEFIEDGLYTYTRNGDGQDHVNKGVIGIKADGINNLCIMNTDINGVMNEGNRGLISLLPGEETYLYFGGSDGGHPKQGPQGGYMGADSRGISLAATNKVYIDKVNVNKVHSKWGWSHGLDVFNKAESTHCKDVSISDIYTLPFTSEEDLINYNDFSMGTKMGRSIGVRIQDPPNYNNVFLDNEKFGNTINQVDSGLVGFFHDISTSNYKKY